MSKSERRILIGLFVSIIILVIAAGGILFVTDYNKKLQVAYDNQSTRSAELMNQVSLTWEAKSQD